MPEKVPFGSLDIRGDAQPEKLVVEQPVFDAGQLFWGDAFTKVDQIAGAALRRSGNASQDIVKLYIQHSVFQSNL